MNEQKGSTLGSKLIMAVILIAPLLFIGLLFSAGPKGGQETADKGKSAITTEDGKQVIEILAKGGYSPGYVEAAANTETVIRVKTNNTFDCSTALRVQAVDFRKNLKPSETVDIPVPAQEVGSEIVGVCSMGMYSFKIKFV